MSKYFVFEGNYVIRNDEDLEYLSNYKSITGDITIEQTSLNDLKGLKNISSIGGSLEIYDNANIVHLYRVWRF